jgi:hypothetical protein
VTSHYLSPKLTDGIQTTETFLMDVDAAQYDVEYKSRSVFIRNVL